MVETMMKRVISEYFGIQEDQRDFFESHLMNNAVTNFVAKVKVIQAINKRAKFADLDAEMFLQLSSLGNTFAHQDPAEGIRLVGDGLDFPDVVMESSR